MIGIALACGLSPAVRAVHAPAAPGKTWLILQSAADPMALIGRDPARRPAGARVMASGDCAEMRAGLYVLALPVDARPTAARPAGSYAKRCTPKAGSLAARDLPAVDPSFRAMRAAPVNFTGADMVSRLHVDLLVRPWYVAAPDDPREGLRVAVDDVAGARRPIEQDCFAPEVARNRTYIAIACATEQVGDQPVYRTTVYRASDLGRVRVIARCRRPQLVPGAIRCVGQSVKADGTVSMAGVRSERL